MALHKHGLVIPLGSFSKLGVAGMTLRGGIGFLTKSYGETSASVLEYGKCQEAGYRNQRQAGAERCDTESSLFLAWKNAVALEIE